ncbi:MAG: hypothetical protein JWR01_2887 [Subtercola sp.]|nr:hypothetical protein [Subtercola sp.]
MAATPSSPAGDDDDANSPDPAPTIPPLDPDPFAGMTPDLGAAPAGGYTDLVFKKGGPCLVCAKAGRVCIYCQINSGQGKCSLINKYTT